MYINMFYYTSFSFPVIHWLISRATTLIIIPHVTFQQSDWSNGRSTILNVKRQCHTACVSDYVTLKFVVEGKIDKVLRGIRDEKSSKDMANSRNLVSTIGALASSKMGDGTRCPEG